MEIGTIAISVMKKNPFTMDIFPFINHFGISACLLYYNLDECNE